MNSSKFYENLSHSQLKRKLREVLCSLLKWLFERKFDFLYCKRYSDFSNNNSDERSRVSERTISLENSNSSNLPVFSVLDFSILYLKTGTKISLLSKILQSAFKSFQNRSQALEKRSIGILQICILAENYTALKFILEHAAEFIISDVLNIEEEDCKYFLQHFNLCQSENFAKALRDRPLSIQKMSALGAVCLLRDLRALKTVAAVALQSQTVHSAL